jgi:S-DNA-T family DNA segregation ATPase FtsK/SpoIIIE
VGGSTKRRAQQQEDIYGELAGAIGGLVIITGILGAIKAKLGLNWPVTILLTFGVLVALGYGAWKARAALKRLLSGEKAAAASTSALKQEAPEGAQEGAQAVVFPTAMGRLLQRLQVPVESVESIPHPTGEGHMVRVAAPHTTEVVTRLRKEIASELDVTQEDVNFAAVEGSIRNVRMLIGRPYTHVPALPDLTALDLDADIPLGYDLWGNILTTPSPIGKHFLVAGETEGGKTSFLKFLAYLFLTAGGRLVIVDGKPDADYADFRDACDYYDNSLTHKGVMGALDYVRGVAEKRGRSKRDGIRPEPMLVIIDEILTFKEDPTEGKEFETALKLTASQVRSARILVACATQHPRDDVISTVIKNNLTVQVAFKVMSRSASKMILGTVPDGVNAELLPASARGTFIIKDPRGVREMRGLFITDDMIQQAVKARLDAAEPNEHAKAVLAAYGDSDFLTTEDLANALRGCGYEIPEGAQPMGVAVREVIVKGFGAAPDVVQAGPAGARRKGRRKADLLALLART